MPKDHTFGSLIQLKIDFDTKLIDHSKSPTFNKWKSISKPTLVNQNKRLRSFECIHLNSNFHYHPSKTSKVYTNIGKLKSYSKNPFKKKNFQKYLNIDKLTSFSFR